MTARRPYFNAAHWGIFEFRHGEDGPELRPFSLDTSPNHIGLDQLQDNVTRLRVQRPAVRKSWLTDGPGAAPALRGREPFVEVDWDTALDLVAGKLKDVIARCGNRAVFGGSYGWGSAGRFHHAQSQIHRFLNLNGGYVSSVDTYSMAAGRVILPYIIGTIEWLLDNHTTWDVMEQHTQLFLCFGGVPLKNAQVSPGGATDHAVAAALDRMARNGARLVNVSPVRDSLQADGPVEWLQIRPNTDAALMLALCQVLFAEGKADRSFLERCTVGSDRLEDYLAGKSDGVVKDPRWASAITGVSATRIHELALEISRSRTMFNVAYSLQRAEHGEQPFAAITALAAVSGQIGLPGGGVAYGYGAMNAIGNWQTGLKGPTFPQGHNPVKDFIPVSRIADMLLNPGAAFTYRGKEYTYPDIRFVYWAGGNPYHHHQDINRLRKAWERPEAIVVHDPYWTATAKLADVVLPSTISLERNDISYSSRERFMVAMRKAVEPFGWSRNDYDIFADLARRFGTQEAFTEGRDEAGWIEAMDLECADRAQAVGLELPSFERFLDEGILDLRSGWRSGVMLKAFRDDPEAHPLRTKSGRIELYSEEIAGFALPDCPPHAAWVPPKEFHGSERAGLFPFHLISDQPARRLHSQLDHARHSLDGKLDGRERVTINAADAAALEIADGDTVELFNDRGRTLAAASVTDAIMPGVLRLSTGAWFDPFGADDLDCGGNPNVLTRDVGASALSQGCAAQSCVVDIRRHEGSNRPSTAHSLPPLEQLSGPGKSPR